MPEYKELWREGRVSVYSDGDKFIAQIQAGLCGETFLAVGYSTPNLAFNIGEEAERAIHQAISETFDELKWGPLLKQLQNLLRLAQAANAVYNATLGLAHCFSPDSDGKDER